MSQDTPKRPVHFTYKEIEGAESDLCQGDILQPKPEIRTLFDEVHPHFSDGKYIAFLVLTQTCDLVRRHNGQCKSRYINLAVVRPLGDVLLALLDRVCEKVTIAGRVVDGLYCKETKDKAVQLLERILNQNAQAEGVFYLHPDAAVQIAEPSVALLQVSVAVRAQEHYDRLVRARSGRLDDQFQSKLGWLIGNLFSRVATRDFSATEKDKLIRRFLLASAGDAEDSPQWVPREAAKVASRQMVDVEGMTLGRIAELVVARARASPREEAIDRVVYLVRDTIEDVPPQQLERIRARLAGDPVFRAACKK